ncbi:MAG TPA: FG-GAP-like repeat-containing protein [Candidatus Paceibacterota bacterium]|nr:FG-GAP-like repeat-containing protein [Verrucomicrobiota bacterium]HSA10977.1 FG-GAP-like repeat-containing protein [Candidatus Paceibacterota bacterium]
MKKLCLLLLLKVKFARADGGPGNALLFAHTVHSVSVPHAIALNAYPFTVTAWFQWEIPEDTLLVRKYDGAFNGWRIRIVNERLYASYFASSTNFVSEGAFGLDGGFVGDPDWHHFAFTVDANGGKVYLDGVLTASGAWSGTPAAATTSHNLILCGSDLPVIGNLRLDEVSLWNTALSQAQIQSNKNRSLAGNEPGLVAYYRCDETNGSSTLGDSAPAGGLNHGSFTPFTVLFGQSQVFPFTPFVETLPATAVSADNATLNGVANPAGTNTSAWFEWGATTNYGSTTAPQPVGSGMGNVNFNQVLGGLSGGVVCHFRAAASNALGVALGVDQSFSVPLFTPVNFNFAQLHRGSLAWGDHDNDGFLDLLITGLDDSPYTVLFRYTGTNFAPVLTPFPGVTGDTRNGAAAWGDFDNDGRLDVALSGSTHPSVLSLVGQVWRNYGLGFSNIQAGISGAVSGSLAWGDYNNDGRSDLLMAGYPVGCAIWNNSPFGFAVAYAGIDYVYDGAARWGDYDNDGRLDILAAGLGGAKLWRNTTNGFINSSIQLPLVRDASIAWADYDNDGRLDFFLTGLDYANNWHSELWRNTGSGFSHVPTPGLPGVYHGAVAWGDCDNDGRPDLLLTGATTTNAAGQPSGSVSQLWRNTAGGFVNSGLDLPGVAYSAVAWGDYDNDGKLDFGLMGATNLIGGGVGGNLTQIWRNNTGGPNHAPSPPGGLSASAANGIVTLTWNAASDTETPSSGLTYNLRMGTAPGGSDLIGPMAAGSGLRLLPEMGNRQLARCWSTAALPVGVPLYWSVQAVDSAFAGSPFAPEAGFRLVQAPPLLTAVTNTSLPFGDTSGDGIVDQLELNVVLSNYFATSPWLHLTNVAGLGGTNVTFALTDDPVAGAFGVEYTTNFADWHFLGPATPRYLFTDTNAPAVPQRHYRLRWP